MSPRTCFRLHPTTNLHVPTYILIWVNIGKRNSEKDCTNDDYAYNIKKLARPKINTTLQLSRCGWTSITAIHVVLPTTDNDMTMPPSSCQFFYLVLHSNKSPDFCRRIVDGDLVVASEQRFLLEWIPIAWPDIPWNARRVRFFFMIWCFWWWSSSPWASCGKTYIAIFRYCSLFYMILHHLDSCGSDMLCFHGPLEWIWT